MLKAVEKNTVVYGVESSGQVERSQKRDFTRIKREEEVIDYFEQSSFCTVPRSVGRLILTKEVVG